MAAGAAAAGAGAGVASATRLVAGLIGEYAGRTPSAERAIRVLGEAAKDAVSWDHLAFRTWGHRSNCIATLAPVFTRLGYEMKGELEFKKKRLRAQWYAPADPEHYEQLPRIFISELKLEEQSEEVRAVVERYCESIPAGGEEASEEKMCHGLPWTAPVRKVRTLLLRRRHARGRRSRHDGGGARAPLCPAADRALTAAARAAPQEDFEFLARESGEYAAWVLTNGYALNHTTVSAHRLGDGYTMERMVSLLEDAGFELNGSGGVIKVSADGGLRQSSTIADNREFAFAGGERAKVPGAYIEFAERLPQPGMAATGRECDLRDGFETASADRIFESTSLAQ